MAAVVSNDPEADASHMEKIVVENKEYKE